LKSIQETVKVARFLSLLGLACMCHLQTLGQVLDLPERSPNAPGASELIRRVEDLDLATRESEIISQVLSGNVPNFLRKLCPIQITNVVQGRTNTAKFYVTPDYLAIGSDDDYFLAPISPGAAQIIADALRCSLPTRKMVDDIYRSAQLKLAPSPIPPTPAMTTVTVFNNHNEIIRTRRTEFLPNFPLGTLIAGHKKDVVISPKLPKARGKVAIYGWHEATGKPIQPLYLGHNDSWVDYSQCTRLVQQKLEVNGATASLAQVLADTAVAGLLSDEGPISNPRYPTNLPARLSAAIGTLDPTGQSPFQDGGMFHERKATLGIGNEVKITVIAPTEGLAQSKQLLLIYYGVPNGNTADQTIGKKLTPGEDWRYDIQHIGAQTRFLRELLTNYAVVVAYLENDLQNWPAWRKKYGDTSIPRLLASVRELFPGWQIETILTGHSGGGSLIFGYLNTLENVPDDIVRIAFLDSNYAYSRSLGHTKKLARWLDASPRHFLCVLAYNDAAALLNGKSFVSAEGGTWGRSHAMQGDLAGFFKFDRKANADFERFSALDGRIQFILKENPERKILHTVQVELNGFIHAIVSGTANENKGYDYYGERAYPEWIQE
jgi:hypothetical protein